MNQIKYSRDTEKKLSHGIFIYLCFVVVYIFISVLIVKTDGGEQKRWVSYFGTSGEWVAKKLSSEDVYQQYFYVSQKSTGIEIAMSSDNESLDEDVLFEVYDAETDELIGSQTVSGGAFNNGFLKIIFEGYALKDGDHCYFKISLSSDNSNNMVYELSMPNSIYYDNLLLNGEVVDNQVIVFNLYCDYTGQNFVLWMFLTALAMYGFYKLQYLLKLTKTRVIQILLWAITLISTVGIVIVYSVMI